MSDFDEIIDELVSNIKTANDLINKQVLDNLIEDNDELYDFLSIGSSQAEIYFRQRVGITLKYLRLLKQRLGYED